jgi:hypothetical protein
VEPWSHESDGNTPRGRRPCSNQISQQTDDPSPQELALECANLLLAAEEEGGGLGNRTNSSATPEEGPGNQTEPYSPICQFGQFQVRIETEGDI